MRREGRERLAPSRAGPDGARAGKAAIEFDVEVDIVGVVAVVEKSIASGDVVDSQRRRRMLRWDGWTFASESRKLSWRASRGKHLPFMLMSASAPSSSLLSVSSSSYAFSATLTNIAQLFNVNVNINEMPQMLILIYSAKVKSNSIATEFRPQEKQHDPTFPHKCSLYPSTHRTASGDADSIPPTPQ